MSFTRFGSLPSELRQYIWHQALHEEVDSRLIFIHRPTMRVMPHTTTVSRVMNANRESRYYANNYVYDVKLDVWTLSIDFQPAAEITAFEQSSASSEYTGGNPALDVAIGLHGSFMAAKFMFGLLDTHLRRKLGQQVAGQVRATLPKRDGSNNSTRKQGTIYLSSQYDRFALTKTTVTTRAPWGIWVVDQCERAFLRDYMCRDFDRFARERARLDPEYARFYQAGGDPQDEYLSRHMAGRLPTAVLKRIRRLVFLSNRSIYRTNVPDGHVCGQELGQDTRDWRLGTFKGVSEFYTVYMVTIPNRLDVGSLSMIRWEKTSQRENAMTFLCKCSNNEEQNAEEEVIEDEAEG